MTRSLVLLVLLAACGAPSRDDGGGVDGGGSIVDAGPQADAFPGAIFAHSSDTLYRLDPDTGVLSTVGAFQFPPGQGGEEMTDLAIDADLRIFGVSFGSLYRIDAETAACTYLAPLTDSFNGLSFLARGTFDPDQETLVGTSEGGNIYILDPATGASTLLGNYGNFQESSGDLVSVEDFGTVATLVGSGGGDVLARIDPQTGHATPIGATGFDGIWGLAFWKDRLYGFTSDGKVLTIDPTTGVGTQLDAEPTQFWGAGVPTTAPVVD
jgi:outer membrane protein assembly factor BamB